jgi:hypothetical protein
MENPNDDPRAFAHEANGHADTMDADGMPQGLAPLFGMCLHNLMYMGTYLLTIVHIQSLMDRGMTPNPSQRQRPTQNSPSVNTFSLSSTLFTDGPNQFSFEINDQNGLRTIRLGSGARPLGRGNDDQTPMPGAHIHTIPNMST